MPQPLFVDTQTTESDGGPGAYSSAPSHVRTASQRAAQPSLSEVGTGRDGQDNRSEGEFPGRGLSQFDESEGEHSQEDERGEVNDGPRGQRFLRSVGAGRRGHRHAPYVPCLAHGGQSSRSVGTRAVVRTSDPADGSSSLSRSPRAPATESHATSQPMSPTLSPGSDDDSFDPMMDYHQIARDIAATETQHPEEPEETEETQQPAEPASQARRESAFSQATTVVDDTLATQQQQAEEAAVEYTEGWFDPPAPSSPPERRAGTRRRLLRTIGGLRRNGDSQS